MINLLKTTLSEEALVEILESPPRRALLPSIGSSEWKRVAGNPVIRKLMPPFRARAEAELLEPLPVLTDALYAEFHLTGNRLHFENLYFERRRRVARAAMCALLDEGAAPEKWIGSLVNKLAEIWQEASWSLPAHVSDKSGKDPLVIDLFCAETANLMGEMINVFGEVLPEELQRKIRERLNTQIFDNFISRNREFGWTRGHNNWNAVCHQGVIGAALAVDEDERRVAKMLVLCREGLPVYLSGFGADGSTSEGPGYWDYGFGWFTILNEQLEARTGGRLSLFEGDERICLIAKFGPSVSLPFHHFVNFADSGASGILRPANLAYLGERLGDDSCRAQSLANYHYLSEKGLGLDDQRLDFFNLSRLCLRCPAEVSGAAQPPREDIFLQDLGVVIAHGRDARGASWDFAAKAGHNDEHHNHNDCGSYILNINGIRMITEIGSPEYVKDFFSERRYEFLAARTLGHSLPIINGCEQSFGRGSEAEVVSCELGQEIARFSIEATRCYPAKAGCRRLMRHFHLNKSAGRLEVRDEFELEAGSTVETAICTEHTAVFRKGGAMIKPAGGVELRILPLRGTKVDRIETHPYAAHDGTPREIHRIVLVLTKNAEATNLGYVIETSETTHASFGV